MNIFEISPWKFNVQQVVGDSWETMYIKYDITDEVGPEVFFKHELKRGLAKPKIVKATNSPKKRVELLKSMLTENTEFSHAGCCGN